MLGHIRTVIMQGSVQLANGQIGRAGYFRFTTFKLVVCCNIKT